MNSSNNAAARSRRSKWPRRLFWACISFISLITVFWQWEYWRSASELKEVHQRVVERLGTDDPVAFMPPKVTDEQNYFANTVLESWLHETTPGTLRLRYNPPKDALLPKGFIKPEIIEGEDGRPGRLDLTAWVAKRSPPSTEEPFLVLARELGDGNGLLPKLAEGLNKPYSIMKPGQREAMESTGGNPWEAAYPDFQNLNGFQSQLGLHLRSAALVGDQAKVTATAHTMLRISESPARSGMIGCLVPLALHGITFEALHETLGHPVWSEEALGRLQVRLGQFDDLDQYQKAFGGEILGMFVALDYLRKHRSELRHVTRGDSRGLPLWQQLAEDAFYLAMTRGPVGWHDANIAFYADCMLDQLGPPGPDAWLSAASRDAKARQRSKEANAWPNPRRILGAIAIPNVGNISHAAAETLFHRRCLIIACGLEKNRLRHGVFPASLEVVKDDMKLFTLTDPARPESPLGYRLEKDGYLLWSAGPDAKDDDGVTEKDWLWRMKRVNP